MKMHPSMSNYEQCGEAFQQIDDELARCVLKWVSISGIAL
jgi:hypothetical protein